jgi:small subunit ribosomal protein S17
MQERKQKTLTGVVTANSSSKTVKVSIDFMVKHPKYGKYMRRKSKLAVHDEHNQAGVGDIVEIAEGRPYSKTKNWRLIKVVQKAAKE